MFGEAVAWALENRPMPSKPGPTLGARGPAPPRSGKRPKLAGARDTDDQQEIARRRTGGEIVPYVYGLIGFVAAIVLAIIVLQFL